MLKILNYWGNIYIGVMYLYENGIIGNYEVVVF